MSIRYLTSGESHGPALVAIIDGIPAGLNIDSTIIDEDLKRRQKGYGAGPRMKMESDHAEIIGGVMAGETLGSPISLMIKNKDHKNWVGKNIESMTKPRPGHADLTAAIKYNYKDFRQSLERASARETAAKVAVGAICKHYLAQFGILVQGYVSSIGEIKANINKLQIDQRYEIAEKNSVRCPDVDAAKQMEETIKETIKAKDTIGGVIEVVVMGHPAGLGSHTLGDKKLTAKLGATILGIQAMKGVEFGNAFENTRNPGTKVHDGIFLENDRLTRKTNRAGGLEGGISNGEPIIIRAAMKPIATTLNPQKTVDVATGNEEDTQYERSDFCPVPRAVPVLEAAVSIVMANALIEKIGGDSLSEQIPRFEKLKTTKLSDLEIDGEEHLWWPD
ncbi:MAG: chorismate synthase [Chloroflexi bacterium]|jgi:chorismate synthase|nr:chorismate synthase [Chloroflexota bacterium]MBT4003785.1 chorismate synthase [Chloroflexota bacterium]MBT4305687.1 chorismate synthase [Chloroflexota bacterium]MBT4533511.1 chorismate synthase [Chloroflexota bacterium]MBT4681846.1 chorismate synthase [Chloroflexota bacterium]